ncbi:MAG TPA: hypothetical protein VL261_05060 [Nitrospira sp.]|jgi:hypothetical protein|nr:hypothetical protein [Nitrospira sp.]
MHNPFHADADMMDFEEATETIVDEEKPEVGLELHVGSNIFRTTNGVIKLQGKEQIVIEVHADPPALLLTMDFYDAQAQRIGHLRRNQLSAAGCHRFAVCVSSPQDPTLDDPLTVAVSERSTGDTIIEVYLFQRRKIRVTTARFYTHRGDVVSITPHFCRIGTGLTMFGDVVEGRGGTAAIG